MQISAPRPPQAPPPPRPDAASARTAIAAATAALTTAAAGDSVHISTAALAASDRLTAGQTPEAANRPPPGLPTAVLPMMPLSDTPVGPQRPIATVQSTTGFPHWDHLPYAPQPLATQSLSTLPVTWPALSRFAKMTVVTGTLALAILLGALLR